MPLYEVFTKGGSMGQPTDIVELLPNDTSKGAWPQTTGTQSWFQTDTRSNLKEVTNGII